MKYSLSILLIINTFSFAQEIYKFPRLTDSISFFNAQYNFNSFSTKVSNKDKNEFIDELIKAIDTNSCGYFTGFEEYYKFIENKKQIQTHIQLEIEKNMHVLDLNGDGHLDVIYDKLNPNSDFQSIYSLIETSTGWKYQKIPGFIIVDFNKTGSSNSIYDTYEWACCESKYNFYYKVEQLYDTIKLLSTTAIHNLLVIDQRIDILQNKKVKMINDSVVLYFFSSYSGNLHQFYVVHGITEGDYIDEKLINEKEYVLVRFHVNDKSIRQKPFEYIIGLVEKDKIKYLWQ